MIKNLAILSVVVVNVFAGLSALAEGENTGVIAAPAPAASVFDNVSMVGGVKSYNSTGRFSDGNGRQLKSKTEYFLGAKSKSDWGFYLMGVESGTSYINAQKNKLSPSDPNLAIQHPIYADGSLKITGQFKEYFPASDYSVKMRQYQQAYYVNVSTKLSSGLDFFNVITARYFSQPNYVATDTMYAFEDYTTISKKLEPWFRLGLGQHSQYEIHSGIPSGTTVELYPYADFIISSNFVIGPRLYLPVHTNATVYDSPKGVSTANVQAEVFVQATL